MALLNHTSSTTEKSRIVQGQLLPIVQVKLAVYKLFEYTALIDSGASFNSILQQVVNWMGWTVLTTELVKARFANGE